MSIYNNIKNFNEFSNTTLRSSINSFNLQLDINPKIKEASIETLENLKKYLTLIRDTNFTDGYLRNNIINFNSLYNSIESKNEFLNKNLISINIKYKYLEKIANKINSDITEISKNYHEEFSIINIINDYLISFNQSLKLNNLIFESNDTDNLKDDLQQSLINYTHINKIEDISFEIDKIDKLIIQVKNLDIENHCDKLIKNIKLKDINYCSTFAEKYAHFYNINNKNKTSDFLISRQFEDSINHEIELSNGQKIKKAIIFNDDSVITFDKNDNIKNYLRTREISEEIKKDTLNFILRKNPNIYKYICAEINNGEDIDNSFILCKTILENSETLKNIKFSIDKLKDKSFEQADDYLNDLINQEKIKKYTYSIVSNKYKYLINQDSFSNFKEFYNLGINTSKLQEVLGKKIAAFKTPEDFNYFVSNVFESLSGFKEDLVLDKLALLNIQPIYKKDKLYVVEIENYSNCKNLGSPQWCIVRDQYYFDIYTGGDSKQYFIFDFSKDEKSNDSMIGFTLYKNGEIHTAHLKNDEFLETNNFLKEIRNDIVLNNIENFEPSDTLIQEIEQNSLKKIKKNIKVEL